MQKDRLMFVDIIRGLAILGVVVVHSSTYGIWYNEPNALKVLPGAAVAALSPIILLGTWAGAFSLITGLVNAYNIHRRVARGRTLKEASAAPAVNAAVLLVIWMVVALLFTHRRHDMFGSGEVFSLISGSLALGRFTLPSLQTLFYKDALVMISMAGFTSALALRILYRNADMNNQSDLWRRARRCMFAAAVFLVITAFIQAPLFKLYTGLYHRGGAALIAAWFVNFFSGPSHVLLPYGGFALIGSALGILLASDAGLMRIRRLCVTYGLVFLALSAVLISLTVVGALKIGEDPLVALFDYLIITPGLYFFAIGSILLLFPLIVAKTEFSSSTERNRLFHRTVWIRRFGMISLSVFILENPVTAIMGRLFHKMFGNPDAEVDAFMTNAPAIILYFALTMVLWFLIVRLWEKAGFKYSFEWLSIKAGSLFRKSASNRLNVEQILYGEQEE